MHEQLAAIAQVSGSSIKETAAWVCRAAHGLPDFGRSRSGAATVGD